MVHKCPLFIWCLVGAKSWIILRVPHWDIVYYKRRDKGERDRDKPQAGGEREREVQVL